MFNDFRLNKKKNIFSSEKTTMEHEKIDNFRLFQNREICLSLKHFLSRLYKLETFTGF